jgi:hypothetical protein
MTAEVILNQLADEVKQLRQQIAHVNQRLDMIYGAVTRLADAQTPFSSTPPSPPPPATTPQRSSDKTAGNATNEANGDSSKQTPYSALTASMMMDPGSMLASLHQHAVNAGLSLSTDTVDRLQAKLKEEEPAHETN